MSMYGTLAALLKNAEKVNSAVESYVNSQTTSNALDVAQSLAQFLGVAAVAGLTEVGVSKFLQKAGLDRVFDSLKENKAFTDYLQDQLHIQDIASISVAMIVDFGIDYFNENVHVGGWIYDQVNGDFSLANQFIQRRDPLALDLDGDGIETISANSGITFDFDGDGLKTGTGWVKGDDGLLVLDRNGNGTIDNGNELFGVDTIKANGQKATDGFDALADLDGNADGVFDAQDAEFANVRVWQDTNQDGVAQTSELKTLAEHNITAINLDSTATSQNSNGNLISATGSFIRDDGTEGTVNGNQSLAANLDLASNPFYREYTDSIELSDSVKALPDMQGSGAVRDLREASMLNADLQSVLAQYSQAQTREQQVALLNKLLTEWAETSNYKTWDQRIGNLGNDTLEVSFAYSWELPATDSVGLGSGSSGGSATISVPSEESGPTAAQLAQKQVLERIKILEIFNSQNFFNFSPTTTSNGSDADTVSAFTLSSGATSGTKSVSFGVREVILTEEDLTINAGQAALLNQAYDALLQSVYDGLLLQTRLKPYVDAINLNLTVNSVELDYSGVEQKFVEVASQDIPKALLDLIEFKKAPGFSQSLSVDFLSPVLMEWIEVLTPDESSSIRAQLGQNSSLLLGSALADQLKGSNLNNQLYGGAGDDLLDGGTGKNQLYGGTGNDVLKVHYNAANNLLAGGTGSDSLYGSHNSDTYVFNLGDGVDTIVETASNSGAVDTLRFGADLSPEQLWFQRNGNNLDILVEGSSDRVTVNNWYASSSSRIELMQSSSGLALTESRVQNLVDAMASFGAPAGGTSNLTPDQRAQLDVVIAANWQ